MQIEVAFLISCLSTVFGIFSGLVSIRRQYKADERKESAQMTTVIVKLEGISEGIKEIKKDLSNVKGDVKELTERLIVAEQEVRLLKELASES